MTGVELNIQVLRSCAATDLMWVGRLRNSLFHSY